MVSKKGFKKSNFSARVQIARFLIAIICLRFVANKIPLERTGKPGQVLGFFFFLFKTHFDKVNMRFNK